MVLPHCIIAILLRTSGIFSSQQLVVIGNPNGRGLTTLHYDYGKKVFPTLRNKRIYVAPNRNPKTGISVTIYCSKIYNDKEIMSVVTKKLIPTKSSRVDNDAAMAKKCAAYLTNQDSLSKSAPGRRLVLKMSDVLNANMCDIRHIGRFAGENLVLLTGKNSCISPSRTHIPLSIDMDGEVQVKELLYKGQAIMGPQGVGVRMAMGLYLEELHLFTLGGSANPTWSFVTSPLHELNSGNGLKIFKFIFAEGGEFDAFRDLVNRNDPGTFSSLADAKSQGSKVILQKTNSAIASQRQSANKNFDVEVIRGKLSCPSTSIRGGKLDRSSL
ncbi:BgTH12-02459 [Blumeria graminis f. sp. triticale]|uniref:BgtE-10102 n=3 Tax=Blumeria graminis TaxID=34373 RepID=A0A9X9MGP9_BLUGR|nr:putative secreted effector protein [Blumeria graminis f. sp. tritici 96224]CAD6502220.1 BgTH12-02459 [Blumeria graminis f. sp. triticale]VDB86291.1 BgtE-10102 [Blumeria graminis f. sp. tritici]